MTNSQHPLEEIVRSIYQAPQAEQQFLDRLGRQLDEKAAQLSVVHRRPVRRWWVYAGAAALLVLIGLLTWQPIAHAVGPLFGYDFIAGVGFVPVEGVRVLAAPVAQSRGAETLTVTQLVTSPKGTRLWYRLEGAHRSPGALALDPAWLQTPDRQKFAPTDEAFSGRLDQVTGVVTIMQTFAPLPPETTHVAFYAAPDWHIQLELRPTGEAVEDSTILYPDACQTDKAVRLCVAMVSLSDEGIYLVVQGESSDPSAFRFDQGWDIGGGTLMDNLGYQSEPTYLSNHLELTEMAAEEPPSAEPPDGKVLVLEALTFEPASGDATALTLRIPEFSGRTGERTIAQETFTIDLGEAPQVGNSFEVDLRMTIRGVEVIFDRAEIVDDPNGVMVRLTSRSSDEIQRHQISVVDLSVSDDSVPGDTHRTIWFSTSLMTGEMQIAFDIDNDNGSLRGGSHTFTVRLEAVDVITVGPFEITWALLRADK